MRYAAGTVAAACEGSVNMGDGINDALGVIVLLYLVSAEAAKRWFYRRIEV